LDAPEFKEGTLDVGFELPGFCCTWFSNRLRESAVLVMAALPLGLEAQTPFAQGLGAGAATIVPAIPELSPSSTEAEALFKLASRLEAGDATIARDDVLARRLYRIAADAGHAGAQCNLGAMLMDGTGGPTDLAGGAALFRKAALRGHGLAQYNLGVMHALGDGVVKDSGEAMAWIEQAINRLPEGEAMTSAKAWREHLRNRMSSREGMIARNRSQELGDAIVRELAAASTGSASRAARSAVRAGMDELGLSPEALQRLGLASSGAALAGGLGANVGGGQLGGSYAAGSPAPLRTTAPTVGSNNVANTVTTPSANLPNIPVETALQEWLKAWSDRRADDYLNFYDARYAPLGGVERAIWAKQRRKAIRHPDWVKVRAEQVSTTEMSLEEVVVGFTQVYSASTGHRETTRKSMIWRWSDGHWRIVSEQASKMSSTAKAVAAGLEEPAPVVEANLPQAKISEPKAPEPKVPESKTATRLQREADAAQSKAQREAAAQQLKAQREAELAASKAKREAELASVRAELESKQAAAKAAREVHLNAEKAAYEAEVSAKQARRDVEIAAAAARKEEKRLAREFLSVAPAAPASAMSPATSLAPAPSALNAPPLVAPNPAPVSAPISAPISAPVAASFESAVRDWLKAWGDRQVDAYLAFYAPGFEVPGGQDRAAWASERRESMTKPAWLKVRADHLKTSVNGESAEARFFQVYVVAPGTVELSNKTMRWVWADGRWQIVQEQSEPHTRKRAGK
jgi:hypothetical protein